MPRLMVFDYSRLGRSVWPLSQGQCGIVPGTEVLVGCAPLLLEKNVPFDELRTVVSLLSLGFLIACSTSPSKRSDVTDGANTCANCPADWDCTDIGSPTVHTSLL